MRIMMKGYTLKKWLGLLAVVLIGCFYIGAAFAESGTGGGGIGQLADNITKTFAAVGKLMIAVAYIAGIGFSIAAIFKFKQHKDNPTQIPMGTPIALLVIGIALIFLPLLIGPAGETIFGSKDTTGAGGPTGTGFGTIPGAKTGNQ